MCHLNGAKVVLDSSFSFRLFKTFCRVRVAWHVLPHKVDGLTFLD